MDISLQSICSAYNKHLHSASLPVEVLSIWCDGRRLAMCGMLQPEQECAHDDSTVFWLQVQQLLTQVDQLTDDRESLDKQVSMHSTVSPHTSLLLM